MPAGKQCNVEPYWVCRKDLSCINDVCTQVSIPAGGSCLNEGSVCADGLVCLGHDRRKICVRPRGPGMKCWRNTFQTCADGLSCVAGSCRTSAGGDCRPRGSICVPGTICAGLPEKLVCVSPKPEGSTCLSDPSEICQSGLTCKDKVCTKSTVPAGGNCLSKGSICADGLVCAGHSRKKICVRPRGPGAKCYYNAFVVCGNDMTCEGRVCKTKEGRSCISKNAVCTNGTVCMDKSDGKQCIKTKNSGESCGSDYSDVCSKGLTCLDFICTTPKIKAGDSCLANGSICEHGLMCAGHSRKKICVLPRAAGKACYNNAFVRCADGLVCQDRKCMTPVDGNCKPKGSLCVPGTICAGPQSQRRCVVPKTEGQQCGIDTVSTCADGLDCVGNICVQPTVPMGGDCLVDGSVCDNGLVCAGTTDKKTCVRPRAPGQRCFYNPFSVCMNGLRCEQGMCKTPIGSSCLTEGSVCSGDSECVGSADKKTCVQPKDIGESCGIQTTSFCKRGLVCLENSCSKPKIRAGGNCLLNGSKCEDGLVCAGHSRRKICVSPRNRGDHCGFNSFAICQEGLTCHNRMCMVQQNEDCLPKRSKCLPGLLCIGQAHRKLCVRPMDEGNSCEQDPFWVCKNGLNCINNVCVKPNVKEGGNCLGNEEACDVGLVCAGHRRRKVCVKPRTAGQKCYVSSFIRCADGLKCDGKVCAVPPNDNCTTGEAPCSEGTVCVGTAVKKTCVAPVLLGGECGTSETKVCKTGLICINKICMAPKITEGSSCLHKNARCEDGLVCVGHSKRKLCVRARTSGERCGRNSFMVCQSDLVCQRGLCKIPKQGNCLPIGSVCVNGTICAGNDNQRKCVKPMYEGKPCEVDPFWVCATGLMCKAQVCVKA